MQEDFINAIGNTKKAGFRAYFELANGQVAITHVYSRDVLELAMQEILENEQGAKLLKIEEMAQNE